MNHRDLVYIGSKSSGPPPLCAVSRYKGTHYLYGAGDSSLEYNIIETQHHGTALMDPRYNKIELYLGNESWDEIKVENSTRNFISAFDNSDAELKKFMMKTAIKKFCSHDHESFIKYSETACKKYNDI